MTGRTEGEKRRRQWFADQRKAFNGLCMLIVKAGKQVGRISIQSEYAELSPGNASLSVE